jgi:hypothetical protein
MKTGKKILEAKRSKNLRKPKAEMRKTGKIIKIMKRLIGRPVLENREGRGCAST